MENKKICYILFFFVNFSTSCQSEWLTINKNILSRVNITKESIEEYSKEFYDIQDFYLLILDKKDSVSIYIGCFDSGRSIGFLDPVALYRHKSKNYYIFIPNSFNWGKDTSFQIHKPDLMFSDYPIWLLTFNGGGHKLYKGVRGYFSPPPLPKDIIQKHCYWQ